MANSPHSHSCSLDFGILEFVFDHYSKQIFVDNYACLELPKRNDSDITRANHAYTCEDEHSFIFILETIVFAHLFCLHV